VPIRYVSQVSDSFTCDKKSAKTCKWFYLFQHINIVLVSKFVHVRVLFCFFGDPQKSRYYIHSLAIFLYERTKIEVKSLTIGPIILYSALRRRWNQKKEIFICLCEYKSMRVFSD
jgi:hypothetical protein